MRNQLIGVQQFFRAYAQRRKRQRVFLHRAPFNLKKHNHHRDAEKHLWKRA